LFESFCNLARRSVRIGDLVGFANTGPEHKVSSVKKETKQASKTGLDALFLPDSVAVIGATERPGTVGRTVVENLLHPSFQGKVYAVTLATFRKT
jgi:hypothetical protein